MLHIAATTGRLDCTAVNGHALNEKKNSDQARIVVVHTQQQQRLHQQLPDISKPFWMMLNIV